MSSPGDLVYKEDGSASGGVTVTFRGPDTSTTQDVERDSLAEEFERARPRLRAVAYRMLGSLSEAEDAVQESWLRASRADTSEVENLGGWLTTVVARISLNMLQSRKIRREEQLAGELSGGWKQRLALAACLIHQPKLLLLDEPTAGMDGPEMASLAEALKQLSAAGISIVVVEHNIRFLATVADRVTVLDAGMVIAEGSPREVAANPVVRDAYLGRPMPGPALSSPTGGHS